MYLVCWYFTPLIVFFHFNNKSIEDNWYNFEKSLRCKIFIFNYALPILTFAIFSALLFSNGLLHLVAQKFIKQYLHVTTVTTENWYNITMHLVFGYDDSMGRYFVKKFLKITISFIASIPTCLFYLQFEEEESLLIVARWIRNQLIELKRLCLILNLWTSIISILIHS